MNPSRSFETTTVAVVTLGCAKNTVETEFIEGSLQQYGHTITNAGDAQVIIVNTCGFIEPAKEESIETILELAKHKEEGNCRALIVTGCLAQRYANELSKEMPEIDAVVGISQIRELPSKFSEIIGGAKICKTGPLLTTYMENRARHISGEPSAYLQISDGCDNRCAYCAIPQIRGRYRSRSIESLLKEAKQLVAHGIREIVLIGQDTFCYGKDIYSQARLDTLVAELAAIPRLHWIRILYGQPQHFSDEIIGLFTEEDKVCAYVDVPFQHASKKVLQEMGRKGDAQSYCQLIKRLRKKIPGIALRTAFILGFPGETDEDFEELARFVEEMQFDYVALFEYSPEEGTVAYDLPDRVPKEVVQERFKVLSDLIDALAIQRGDSYLGRKVPVLVESIVDDMGEPACQLYQGRTIFQAPEIDGEIIIKTPEVVPEAKIKLGDIVNVKICDAQMYDFEGELEC